MHKGISSLFQLFFLYHCSCNFRFESSPFKEQATVNANWLPMDKGKTPTPRPGTCSSTKNKRYTIIHSNQTQSDHSNPVPTNGKSVPTMLLLNLPGGATAPPGPVVNTPMIVRL